MCLWKTRVSTLRVSESNNFYYWIQWTFPQRSTVTQFIKRHISIASKYVSKLCVKRDTYRLLSYHGCAPPPRSKFFHFHAVFGKNLANNRLAPPGNPGSATAFHFLRLNTIPGGRQSVHKFGNLVCLWETSQLRKHGFGSEDKLNSALHRVVT